MQRTFLTSNVQIPHHWLELYLFQHEDKIRSLAKLLPWLVRVVNHLVASTKHLDVIGPFQVTFIWLLSCQYWWCIKRWRRCSPRPTLYVIRWGDLSLQTQLTARCGIRVCMASTIRYFHAINHNTGGIKLQNRSYALESEKTFSANTSRSR